MKLFSSAVVAGLLAFTVQGVQAFDLHGGNALWGKYAIQTCRSCHTEKGLTSLDPQERSAELWETFFVDDYRKLREMDHDFSAVGINDRQLENIHKYLVETASQGRGGGQVATTTSKKTYSTTFNKPKVVTGKSSGGKKFDMDAGSAGKGRYIFRKCLACHKKNDAPIISPADRTRKAWTRFFERDFKKFKKYMPKFDTYKYSISQMEHLHQFFLKYALDAEKPKTCE
jgi:cytochrome c2